MIRKENFERQSKRRELVSFFAGFYFSSNLNSRNPLSVLIKKRKGMGFEAEALRRLFSENDAYIFWG